MTVGRPVRLVLTIAWCAWGLQVLAAEPTSGGWKQFVRTEGQPIPIPAEWVATPEGRIAHSIRLPNPLGNDGEYRRGMSSEAYFEHLCKSEAGVFVFRTVTDVEGLYFMRPPKRPTDSDLKARYRLEAPEIERTFQLLRALPSERAKIFIGPPYNTYRFVEEPNPKGGEKAFLRASGYEGNKTPMRVEPVASLKSRYGLTWRGIRRTQDREMAIAGSEWILLDLQTRQVLAVMRDYGRTGHAGNSPEGIWWLNAVSCPVFSQTYRFATSEKLYDFVAKVVKPLPIGAANGK